MRTLSLGLIALLLVVSARAEDLVTLAREYRQLREVRGWFSGGDQWVEAVDSWNGRKHQVMGRLGALLGDGRHRAVEVEELMWDRRTRPLPRARICGLWPEGNAERAPSGCSSTPGEAGTTSCAFGTAMGRSPVATGGWPENSVSLIIAPRA
jgi:hypothetical protein